MKSNGVLNIKELIKKNPAINENNKVDASNSLGHEFDKLTKYLDKKLEGLMLIEDTSILNSTASSTSMKLRQSGFSSKIINQLKNSYLNTDFENGGKARKV